MINKSGNEFSKICLLTGFFLVSSFASLAAMADVKLRAGISNVAYSTDMASPTRPFSKAHNLSNVPLIGATLISETGWYVDFSLATVTIPGEINRNGTLTRRDGALVAGKSVTGDSGYATSWFVGYKDGNTNQEGQPVGTNPTEYTMSTAGIVFGGGIGIPLSGGTLAMNAGMGVMQMKWMERYNGTQSNDTSVLSPGYSYGLSYSYPFTQTVGASVEYKGQAYNYRFDGVGAGPNHPSTLSERVTNLVLSFYAIF